MVMAVSYPCMHNSSARNGVSIKGCSSGEICVSGVCHGGGSTTHSTAGETHPITSGSVFLVLLAVGSIWVASYV